jgi:hypothetical protein
MPPSSFITAKELKANFKQRVRNLLRERLVLVKRELEYLLGETGPGSLRIDPELLRCLTNKRLFTSPLITHFPKAKSCASKKTELQNLVVSDLHSPKSANLMSVLLGHYIESLEIRSVSPLVLVGAFEETPVHFLVNNGGWVMPDRTLFDFVSEAQKL